MEQTDTAKPEESIQTDQIKIQQSPNKKLIFKSKNIHDFTNSERSLFFSCNCYKAEHLTSTEFL
jgi:hypothetical protein